jgi:hypothetical protein
LTPDFFSITTDPVKSILGANGLQKPNTVIVKDEIIGISKLIDPIRSILGTNILQEPNIARIIPIMEPLVPTLKMLSMLNDSYNDIIHLQKKAFARIDNFLISESKLLLRHERKQKIYRFRQ